MMEAHDRLYVEKATYARTIPIPTLGVGTTEFDLTRERALDALRLGSQRPRSSSSQLGLRGVHRRVPDRQEPLQPQGARRHDGGRDADELILKRPLGSVR